MIQKIIYRIGKIGPVILSGVLFTIILLGGSPARSAGGEQTRQSGESILHKVRPEPLLQKT